MNTSSEGFIWRGAAIAAVIAGGVDVFACNEVLGINDFQRGVGECEVGGKRCVGDRPLTCDANGQWAPEAPCDTGAGQRCVGGACLVDCAPGDIRCSGDSPQTCGLDGNWQDNGTICNDQCGGCDVNTGACAASNGTACDDGDICTVSGSCQAGICISVPNSDHAWAHWDLKSEPPSPRYIWNSAVVYDKQTHLTWQRYVTAGQYIRDDAENYCACLNGESNNINCDSDKIPGYPSSWRLPTRIELASIVDYSHLNPSIDIVAFPSTPSVHFWSSSSYASDSNSAWVVHFFVGQVFYDGVGAPRRVRCAR